jgi:hypothetical protein
MYIVEARHMRNWWNTTLECMGRYIMANGWVDPTGTAPPIWFADLDRAVDALDVEDPDDVPRAA